MFNVKRYLRHLHAYSTRQRRLNASRWIEKLCHTNWKVVELECGSCMLASKVGGAYYIGIDPSRAALKRAERRLDRKNIQLIQADPRQVEIPDADIVIFLGLLEKISIQDFSNLLSRIHAKRILFSFTEPPQENLFRWTERLMFRGLQHRTLYHSDVVAELLEQHGFKKREIRRSQWYGPGKMVLAERSHKATPKPAAAKAILTQSAP